MKKIYAESELALLAKHCRTKAGKSKADAARELGVSKPSVFNAEEKPSQSLTLLRIRMIETYSRYKVEGPVFIVKKT